MITQNYNPDVLTCLANLSNDEVFTPPAVVNKMLDLLPTELWSNPDAKFLDPVSKTGVFLREIAKRLMAGLEEQIPDVQERANHIFGTQLYGLAITELTALMSRRSVYCSKFANGEYSICTAFDDEQGNIRFEPTAHSWQGGRCIYCGASQDVYDRGEALESHAYRFIHTDNPKKLFPNMKFDVIIGNPPYQLNDGGGSGSSAIPLYHRFVEQAQKLQPRYLTMIIPSRWFVGGKGLDEFREVMLKDNKIRVIHDFYDASDCFPGVEIKGGVCYFLWDRDNTGLCEIITHEDNTITSTSKRPLLENGSDVFIRFNNAISIYHKVSAMTTDSFMNIVSVRKPFGYSSTFTGYKKEPSDGYTMPIYANKTIGYLRDDNVTPSNNHWVKEWKVYITFGYGAGEGYPHQIINKPILGVPNSCCTETYLLIGGFKNKERAENAISYIKTRFFRFMVMLRKNTQNGTRNVYQFVPMQDFNEPWTDEKLYAKYGLTEDEIAFIESMIRPME